MNSIVDFQLKSVDEGKFFCWSIVSRVKLGIARSNSLWGCEMSDLALSKFLFSLGRQIWFKKTLHIQLLGLTHQIVDLPS
jgi:hypothetical protein